MLNFVGFLKLACEQMVIERIQLDLGLRLILTNTHHYGSPAMGNCLKAVTGNEQILVFWSSGYDPLQTLDSDFRTATYLRKADTRFWRTNRLAYLTKTTAISFCLIFGRWEILKTSQCMGVISLMIGQNNSNCPIPPDLRNFLANRSVVIFLQHVLMTIRQTLKPHEVAIGSQASNLEKWYLNETR